MLLADIRAGEGDPNEVLGGTEQLETSRKLFRRQKKLKLKKVQNRLLTGSASPENETLVNDLVADITDKLANKKTGKLPGYAKRWLTNSTTLLLVSSSVSIWSSLLKKNRRSTSAGTNFLR